MKATFSSLGTAEEVTGSKHVIEIDGERYLIDFRKIVHEVITSVLVIILLLGNTLFCYADNDTSIDEIIYSEDTTIYAEDTTIYADNMVIYAEEMTIYAEDLNFYIEELTYYAGDMIYYQFGEYVDDIYIVALQTQEYIDQNTVIIDPETGKRLNIGSILAKLGAGITVIIACVTITVATGGAGGAAILAIALPYVQVASASAAFGAAINGSINFVTSGGSGEKFLEGAIEGAADGFMWGAVFSPGAMKLAKLQIGKVSQAGRRVSQIKNFSELTRRTIATTSGNISNAMHAITEIELVRKYGNLGKQLVDDISYYTGYGHEVINHALRLTNNDPVIRDRIARISRLLKDHPLPNGITVFRGNNTARDIFFEKFGIRNIKDLSDQGIVDEIARIIKNNPRTYTEPAFTSTSIELGQTVKDFATYGVKARIPSNLKIIEEIRHTQNSTGTYGAAFIEKISRYPSEREVLLDIGLRIKPIDIYREKIFNRGEWHDVIRIIYETL